MNSKTAKKRIQAFLGEDVGATHPIQHLKSSLVDLAIFGGMIRDLTLGRSELFNSDIDLVSSACAEEIYEAIREYAPIRNRFGGYRFFFLGRPYDIWSLEDTWAVRQGYVNALGIEDLCRTTFFTIDAAIFNVKSERFYLPKFCRRSIERKVLDINLIHNPFPAKMAIKAVELSIHRGLRISPALCEFVLRNGALLENKSDFKSSIAKHLKSAPDKPFEFSKQLSLEFL
ncbi:hypothetical protein SAMN05444506_11479 [Pseudomonas syringae]|uniref:hypothetical protein n=1 Tax=Pseudomonas syringae group TaxID=136849 RepID=UPI00089A958D|nr:MULTISPECIES: hypothetical protein [Pseudomonas syringae group]SDZ30755.1 hypothetical protein SAMN05444506_11479 [Pseudomonas syringae]